VIYLERVPAAPLNQYIRTLWYTHAPEAPAGRERILPSGCIQVIVNLAGDFIHPEHVPSLIAGARSECEIVDRADMADLIGIVFEPGGFTPFVSDAADTFSNRFTALEDVWGAKAKTLRDRLRDIPAPSGKLLVLEQFLRGSFAPHMQRNRTVDFALNCFTTAPAISTVREVAEQTGWSMRHFSQIFREEVGLTPKVWCRVQRFQRAVRLLHAGADVAWAELALDLGYYDQSHFANEFRAFSGIDATTYCALRTPWANHVAAE
jgi:AraC-like DNA-binding protein